jgi:hypothetical protein
MAVSTGGLDYEARVRSAMEQVAKHNNNLVIMPDATAGFNAHEPDLKIKYKQRQYNIEIKSSPDDQMGGTSIRLQVKPNVSINPVLKNGQPTLDADTYELIKSALKGIDADVKAFIKFLQTKTPTELHAKITGFPMVASKDAWEAATAAGLLKPLNKKVRLDASFIRNHYKKKNCFYIQIGGAGLFYLSSNPLNLPVPQLTGEIDIEIRAARSGSNTNVTYRIATVGGGIRAQARLKAKITTASKYSLDNPEHVRALFP